MTAFVHELTIDPLEDSGEWPEDEAPDLDYEMEMAKSLQGK